MKAWLLAWLKEKTTWAGMLALASIFGVPDLAEPQQTALVALAASLFAMSDRNGK